MRTAIPTDVSMRRGQVHMLRPLVKWLCRPSDNVLPTTRSNRIDVGPHMGRETRSSFQGRVICLVSLVGVLVMSALLVELEDCFHFSTKRTWVAYIFPQSPETSIKKAGNLAKGVSGDTATG